MVWFIRFLSGTVNLEVISDRLSQLKELLVSPLIKRAKAVILWYIIVGYYQNWYIYLLIKPIS